MTQIRFDRKTKQNKREQTTPFLYVERKWPIFYLMISSVW
jgi:hypothetical protein